MRTFGPLFLVRALFLVIFSARNGSFGLNIYSALPEHVVEWLKRHILVEIKSIDEFRWVTSEEGRIERVRVCDSSNGPFCRHIKQGTEGRRLDLQRDELSGMEFLGAVVPETLEEFEWRKPAQARLIPTKGSESLALLSHCRLPLREFLFCIRIAFKGLYDDLFESFTGMTRRAVSFVNFGRFWDVISKYTRGIMRLFKKRRKKIFTDFHEKISRLYIVTEDFTLPPDSRLQDNVFSEGSSSPQREVLLNPWRSSRVLFDETFSPFLKSRFVRQKLINSLTWVLEQSTPYSSIKEDWRNELLNRKYVVFGEIQDGKRSNSQVLTSPYTSTRISSELLKGRFQDKFEKARTSWNGVSSKMEFSSLRPNIRLLPEDFCNDERLECSWHGHWEVRQEESLGVELLSKSGKFLLKSEKFVLSDLPITVRDSIIENKFKSDLEKTISISGLYNSKLMWKSKISLNELLKQVYHNGARTFENSKFRYKSKWVNALDFADTVPYSMINELLFETDFLIDPRLGGIILGPFSYNLLNPAFNYIPQDAGRSIEAVKENSSEFSLIMYFIKKSSPKENQVASISLTTMFVSKASPVISLYNIENRGLYMKDEISEITLCNIKKNMAEITRDN